MPRDEKAFATKAQLQNHHRAQLSTKIIPAVQSISSWPSNLGPKNTNKSNIRVLTHIPKLCKNLNRRG